MIMRTFRLATLISLLAVWGWLTITQHMEFTRIAETPLGPLVVSAFNAENLTRHPISGRLDITNIATAYIKVGADFEDLAKLLTKTGFNVHDTSKSNIQKSFPFYSKLKFDDWAAFMATTTGLEDNASLLLKYSPKATNNPTTNMWVARYRGSAAHYPQFLWLPALLPKDGGIFLYITTTNDGLVYSVNASIYFDAL